MSPHPNEWLPPEDPAWTYAPPAGPLSVLYVDRDLVVVDKPSGLLGTPGRGEHLQDSVQSRLRATYPTAEAVHRLDLDTSGLLLFSLRGKATRSLMAQFRERRVHKTYLAWVIGHPPSNAGTIDLPLQRDPNRPRSFVDPNGKPSLTRYQLRETRPHASLLALEPETGRSHQLRVHLAALGHPIWGDRFYGPPGPNIRLLLHAHAIRLFHPWSGAPLHFVSPTPLPEPPAGPGAPTHPIPAEP